MATYQPNWDVRAVTIPGPDTDLSLYVSFDNARFVFGAGEGTQRAFAQKRLGFSKLSGVFVGSGESKGRGGLGGLVMSACDAGVKTINIVGPPDLSQYLGSLRGSVTRDTLTVNLNCYPRDVPAGSAITVFESRNMTVRAIALIPPVSPNSRRSSNTPYDPFAPTFRPSVLSPKDLQSWCSHVVMDMFQNNVVARLSKRAASPPPSPSESQSQQWSNVFLAPDGTINAARPDTRHPLPTASDEDVRTQMVYICETPDVRGKFDVKKATDLGVPNGPIRGKLTRGESIEVTDPATGVVRVVRPEDCLVGGGPGSALVVINCTVETMPQLLGNQVIQEYHLSKQRAGQDRKGVHLVVHRVPRDVWQTESYKEWIKDFGDQTQHLIAETDLRNDSTTFNSAAWNTLQLSLIDPAIFCPPFVHSASEAPSMSPMPPNVTLMKQNAHCRMHPPSSVTEFPWHGKDVPFNVTQETAEQAREKFLKINAEYAEACKTAQAAVLSDVRSLPPPIPQVGDDIVITTLGTGSAIPSKHRNVSCTYLYVPEKGGILLDAGEGSLGQLRRKFGNEGELNKVYEDLKIIFISHMHADHHLGLNAILEDRFRLGITSRLYVVAPYLIALNMQETATWQIHATEKGLINVRFVFIERLTHMVEAGETPDASEASPWGDSEGLKKRWPLAPIHGYSEAVSEGQQANVQMLLHDFGLKYIWAPTVAHRGRAYGLVIEHVSGWKIVYSGDTKPSSKLIKAGQNATLLIHEATLEDDKPEVAAQKGHSTFSQAIDVGKRMNAKYVLLNHFSQRYPKLPKLPKIPAPISTDTNGPPSFGPQVSISFDFMSLRLVDIWKMSYYMEPLSILLAEPEDDEGADVEEAVKKDVNPTVDVDGVRAYTIEGEEREKKVKPVQEQGGALDAVQAKSKKWMKKDAARAAKAAKFGKGGEKRAASPGRDTPEAKRRSTDLDGMQSKLEEEMT